MKKLFLLALLCVLSPLGIHAQTAVTGNLKTVGVANASGSNTYVRFTLVDYGATIPKVSGTNVIMTATQDFHPDANGNISGNIQGNDTITPGGTKYLVCIYFQGQQFRCNTYSITGATFNLNSAIQVVTPVNTNQNILYARSMTFTQATPSLSWLINHNFGNSQVYVFCTDLNGKHVEPDGEFWTDANNVTVTWWSPTSGTCMVMNSSNVALTSPIGNAIVGNPIAAQVVGPQPLNVQGPLNVTGGIGANAFQGSSPWFDVTSPKYGAFCNGSADDTAAIQSAINDAKTVGIAGHGNGIVFVPPGTVGACKVSALNADNSINLVLLLGGIGAAANTQIATLNFTGNCVAAACFSARSALGLQIYGGEILFSGATTGPMIDFQHCIPGAGCGGNDAANIGIHGTEFIGPGPTIGPMINAQQADFLAIDSNTSFQNASVFVTGPTTNGQYSDNVAFNNVFMYNPGTAAVQNASVNWSFNNIIAKLGSGSSCVPFIQYVSGYNGEQDLTITNSLINPGVTSPCTNAFTFVSVPTVSGNLGGLSITSNIFLGDAGASSGSGFSIGNGQMFTASGNIFQLIPVTVFALGTGANVNIGPNVYVTTGAFMTGTPANGTVVDTTGKTNIYGALGINATPSGTAVQGTDVKLLTSGTISGTSSPLCTDTSGGATTTSCPNSNSSTVATGVFNVDGVTYTTLAGAIAAAPASGAVITVPPPGLSFSSTIAITSSTQNLTIRCMGGGWKNNGSTRGPTTLTWTGGASPMFTVNAVNGFKIEGCDLNNTGTATEAVRITQGHDIVLKEISISSPTVAFSTDGISCQPGVANVRIYIEDSFLLDGAPIMVDCDRVNQFNVTRTTIRSSGNSGVRVGNTTGSTAIMFTDDDCESSGSGSTYACIDLIRTEGTSIKGGYCEATAASQLCVRMSNVLTAATHISGLRMTGLGAANYAIETNGAPALVVEGVPYNQFVSGGVHFLANVSDTILQGNVLESGTPNVGINFSGTGTFATTAVGSGACSATVTVAMTGVATGMRASAITYTTAPTITDEQLIPNIWLTSGNVNINRCNPTAGSLTPTALTFNVGVN